MFASDFWPYPHRHTLDIYFPHMLTQSECTQTHSTHTQWKTSSTHSQKQEQIQCLKLTHSHIPANTSGMHLPCTVSTTHHTTRALGLTIVPYTCVRTFPPTKCTHLILTYPPKSQRHLFFYTSSQQATGHILYLYLHHTFMYIYMCIHTHSPYTHMYTVSSQTYMKTQMCHNKPTHIYHIYFLGIAIPQWKNCLGPNTILT